MVLVGAEDLHEAGEQPVPEDGVVDGLRVLCLGHRLDMEAHPIEEVPFVRHNERLRLEEPGWKVSQLAIGP